MTSREFQSRLIRRLHRTGASLPDAATLAQLQAYLSLLARWNAKINLTALPLEPATDETFDRLFVEPLVAARYFPSTSANWFDLGTGGGSPALPLKIVYPTVHLTMVESKVRKAAFLKEAIRTLALTGSVVENARFEDISHQHAGTVQVVTVRAVRPDSTLFKVMAELLSPGGRLLLFGPHPRPRHIPAFAHLETVPLIEAKGSYLGVYGRVFHVEQPG